MLPRDSPSLARKPRNLYNGNGRPEEVTVYHLNARGRYKLMRGISFDRLTPDDYNKKVIPYEPPKLLRNSNPYHRDNKIEVGSRHLERFLEGFVLEAYDEETGISTYSFRNKEAGVFDVKSVSNEFVKVTDIRKAA